MKIVRAHALDTIDDYVIDEVDRPDMAAHQILIEVAACGVGYVDALVALGRYQVKPELPHIPGKEVAGRIRAIGAAVRGFSVGDRVLAVVQGGFAEWVCASTDAVLRIPARMSFSQAAGFRINYLTALHGLRDRARLEPGEWLLVLGAGGGVGSAALQVGKVLGANIVAAASTADKRAHALALGADRVIDTESEGWRERLKAACDGRGPDVVFDPVCGPLFEPAFRSLHWRGRHLVVGFVGGPIPALRANLPLMKGASLVGVDVRQFMLYEQARADAQLAEMLAWAGDGRIEPPIGREYAFDQFRQALQFALSGQGTGKTVLRIGQID
ncbi:MAG: NADPH:quinone oxidoreductase family protein [Burkholderiaceae bacterium]